MPRADACSAQPCANGTHYAYRLPQKTVHEIELRYLETQRVFNQPHPLTVAARPPRNIPS